MQQTNIFTIINTKIQAQISPAVPLNVVSVALGVNPNLQADQ